MHSFSDFDTSLSGFAESSNGLSRVESLKKCFRAQLRPTQARGVFPPTSPEESIDAPCSSKRVFFGLCGLDKV